MQGTAAQNLPGIRFQVRAPATEVSPLRTDIAGFVGPTLRGPVGELTRINGYRQYLAQFGGLTTFADTAYAIRGYFENGGEIAYVIRVLGEPVENEQTVWTVGEEDAVTLAWTATSPAAAGFQSREFTVTAATPGTWARGMRIEFRYRLRGENGEPQVDIEVHPLDEPPEYLFGLTPGDIVTEVEDRSNYIRLSESLPAPVVPAFDGPRSMRWTVTMPHPVAGEEDPLPDFEDYENTIETLAHNPEVSLLTAPDLHAMQGKAENHNRILSMMVATADIAHDRQVIATPPSSLEDNQDLIQWVGERRAGIDPVHTRSLAIYHPWLRVTDQLGGQTQPLRDISPVGHVAGVISRLDRERGAHHTPANAAIFDAVDLSLQYDQRAQGEQSMNGINVLRCIQGRGLQIWGGRTLIDAATYGRSGLFLAHRRLIHRLIRAIRRVALPLVFDTNGPELWLKFVRVITGVLLEAYRAGALKGERPEQAFLVRCDDTTNPPEIQDLGQLLCEVYLAPAAPMEFITLRIADSREGRLEVIEE